MGTQHADLFARLAAPFEPEEVKVRSQAGRQLHYVTARTVMNRLDEVLGPENWEDEYPVMNENSVLCRLTIRLPDGSKLTKCDAGGFAGMADSGDDDKSGFSDAFKRAAVKFGVSRYLYRDGVPRFAQERIPASGPVASQPVTQPNPPAATAPSGSPPRTGKALFAWTKEQEQRHEVGLLKYLNSWGKLQELPARMIDWDAEQVQLAYAEACRKLNTIQAAQSESQEATEEDIPFDRAPEAPRVTTPPPRGAPRFTWPQAGKSAFAFAKKVEEYYQSAILNGLKQFAASKGWDSYCAKWTQDQLDEAIADMIANVKQFPNYKGELDGLQRPMSGLAQARKDLVAAAKAHITKMYDAPEGVTAWTEAMKTLMDTVSPLVANGRGHEGEVLDSIQKCEDETWLRNIIAELGRIEQMATRVVAVPAGPSGATPPAEDDIPF